MGLSDVYNKIVGSLTPSNNSLLDQGTSTYTSITTSSSPPSNFSITQNQQIANQLTQNHNLQGAGYFNYQTSNVTLLPNIDVLDFSKSPDEKKKKDKEMLVNILKSKLQDAR